MRGRPLLIGVILLAAAMWYGVYRLTSATFPLAMELQDITRLAELVPKPEATLVFDRSGQPAFSFFVEQRIAVPIRAVSPHMVNAILAVEDRRFFSHRGLDPLRIVAAARRNLQARRIVEGGSTITQQLARVSQLSPERTYGRKVREVLLAARLEERYSKHEILEQYLNAVYFGEGFYGVEAAARGHFGKSASDLGPAEAALLAALVRAPSKDAPCIAPDRAKARRNLVLRLMREEGHLTDAEFQAATSTALPEHARTDFLATSSDPSTGRYFQEELRRQLVALFGADRVLRGGLRVYSTYDPTLQRAAEEAVSKRIAEIVKGRPRVRDLQGSLVAIEPHSGDVLALVGGRDFDESSFNRATQARRQAGSAFKPIIYAAALERGYAPGTVLRDLDTPIQMVGKTWLPSGEHERSEYTLRRALKVSSNRAAAQLLQQVGVTTTVYYAHRLGIESQLPMVPSLALGTGEVTLLELTAVYGAFANRGMLTYPRLITRVENTDGTLRWASSVRQTQAVSTTTAYLMSSMLSDVVSSGTAANARSAGFKLRAAGKTGTTDDYADAWFIGYTPHIVAGVWFGMDRPAPIMNRGFAGTVAVPAWARFMSVATAGAKSDWYEMPPDIEKVAICPVSGGRATDACRHASMVTINPEDVVGTSGTSYPLATSDFAAPVGQEVRVIPPAKVYEELFPLGAAPEPCWMHGATSSDSRYAPSGETTTTPTVDDILGRAAPSPTTSNVQPVDPLPAGGRTRLVIERIPQPDGSVRIVVREKQ